ncbi:MAG: Ig-like domain-containing protein [Gemmatimonadota bacterium]|nr:Ig-like domain-containing protein [Gemmatimonadota bacterium]
MLNHHAGVALSLLMLTACARIGSPAGGPDDKVPPALIGTVPESVGVYPGWKHDVEFRFDEIISEGGSPNQGLGTGDLEKLILLSPTEGIPVVRWKRNRITVHPREGWKPDRVYRLELLPGITDLRRNRLDTTTVLTFSTGGPEPTDTLAGLVIDWVAGRPARAALVELVLSPDSLIYRTLTDSGGRFSLGPLPRGDYAVYAAIDQNHNLRRERRENYDSAAAASGTLLVPPLWLLPRDTLGPRIQGIAPDDSMSATITFGGPLDPSQRFDSLRVRLLLQKDSVAVPFRSLLPKAVDDSLQKIVRATADSLKAAADTTRKDSAQAKPTRPPLPVPPARGKPGVPAAVTDPGADSILASRPKLFDRLVLRVDSAFVPETKYVVLIEGIRSAAGVASSPKAVLAIPKPVPVPTAADSARATGALDSLFTEPDSTPPSPRP